METITRRIDGKVKKFTIFKKDEDHPYSVHWKKAWKDGWAETDDGYVAQCLAKTTYKDAKGRVMSGKTHTASSKYLVHKKDLSARAKKVANA